MLEKASKEDLYKENRILKEENRWLQLKIKKLEHLIYGRKAEKRAPGDERQEAFQELDALSEKPAEEPSAEAPEDAPADKEKTKKKKRAKPGPKPLDPSLERVREQVPDPDLNQLICPNSGKVLKKAFVEHIEVLARKPPQYYVRVIERNVFAGEFGEAPVYTPWPDDVMPRSRVDVSVLSHLITARFCEHLPYYRIESILGRMGVEFSRGTMLNQVRLAALKLEPLYHEIVRQALASGYLQVDATVLPLIDPERPGKKREGCLWTYRALDGPVFFEFATTKKGETPRKTLQHYQGVLQTDGANNFGGATAAPGVVHCGCWAHARRYFHEAERLGEQEATAFLDVIDKLFERERQAREEELDPEQWRRMRERESLPMVETLRKMALEHRINQPMRKTAMAKAVNYLLEHIGPLTEAVRQVPSRIDNNLVENAIRPVKLGAKNWLFVGHPDAGPRTAQLYTLVENCRMLQIDPEAYLADILRRIDDHPAKRIGELLPRNWLKSRQEALSKNG